MEPYLSEPKPEKRTAMEFARAYLKTNPQASFREVRTEAEREGVKLFPIVYGRAKALEGLVPMKPRRRRRKNPSTEEQLDRPSLTTAVPSLEGIVAAVREVETERDRYRAALMRIRDQIEEALR